MKKSESIVELSKALAQFQKDVKQPFKDKKNPYFNSKYVPLENVVEAITDTAPKNGLSFTQWALNDEKGRVGVATLLMHESGEYIEYDPVFMTADKNTAQGAGSLMTYLKRYSLSAIFGITSDEDDDGNNASKGNNNQQSKQVSKNQLDQLHSLAERLANLYDWESDKLKEKLGFKNQITPELYGTLMNRINDGFTKLAMEKGDEADKVTDLMSDVEGNVEQADAGDKQ